ncbi:MAG: 2-amino-4-hydroxy-6-hydroxymethyldihydropteridine diphosphokinase [Thermoanaerobaculia bacterium]|nr:2-amino-4-hydroxy-6-hydroxymethyldihydropteridine diphosphokinase [Thermoanaerobaculia bacterium]
MKIGSSITETGATRPVYLGLGSNLDDPIRRLRETLIALSRHLGPLRVASLYRTEPVSPVPQEDYWNTAVEAVSGQSGRRLLDLAKRLEGSAGRGPGPRWGPRPLDIDLLLLGEETHRDEELIVPHRALGTRRFVLAPLADLVPGHPVPGLGATVAELLKALPDRPRVERIGWAGAPVL